MRIPTPLKAGFVIFASVTLTLVAADVALRFIGYQPTLAHEWLLGTGVNTRLPDQNIILIPPRFLLDKHYSVDPTLKTVVTLGDSFTEGYPVKPVDNYPSVLGRLLGQRARPVNIINMGIGDSGPDQHLRLMKEYILPRVTPDIVVWSFYPNDVGDNILQAVYNLDNNSLVPLNATKHWLYKRQKLFRSLPLPNSVKESSPVLRLLFRILEIHGKRGRDAGNPAEIEKSITKIRLAIEEMERLAQLHEFQVTYVLIAPQVLYLRNQQLDPWGYGFHLNAYRLLQAVIATQTRFIDARFLDPEILVCGSQFKLPNLGNPFLNDGRDHNSWGYRHFNESGYYLLADTVATCLLNNGI